MGVNIQADLKIIEGIPAVPKILRVVCQATGMGFAAVARVTEERWVACAVQDEIDFGLKAGGELKVETTICHEIRQSGKPIIIDNVQADEIYCTYHTPALYNFESYVSVPILLADGTFFGTLCAIDPKPAKIDMAKTLGMFTLFAELIGFHIDASQKLADSENSLLNERKTAQLREEFIAVLGHDLRNPLASILAAGRLLQKTPLNDRAQEIVGMMQNSVYRMSAIIDNVMDFARGRLGGGLTLQRNANQPLETFLQQVIDELQIGSPDRIVETTIDLSEPINCDRTRIGQLFSNLLANAMRYSTPGTPVEVHASTKEHVFELSVTNQGAQIPPAAMEKLFQPFARGVDHTKQQGLGLGLYIASEIARAHDGTLTATSTAEETCFTFRMPLVHFKLAPLEADAIGT